MTATFTDAQLTSFFKQWEPKVQYFGIEIVPAGYFGYYKQGRALVKAQALAAKAEANAKSRATRWTAEEYDVMPQAYINNGRDRKACLAEFRQFSQRHTDDAVTFAAYSAAALDTKDPSTEGFKDYAKGLLNALNAIEPKRFKGTR